MCVLVLTNCTFSKLLLIRRTSFKHSEFNQNLFEFNRSPLVQFLSQLMLLLVTELAKKCQRIVELYSNLSSRESWTGLLAQTEGKQAVQ
jgi:hypothetical protein